MPGVRELITLFAAFQSGTVNRHFLAEYLKNMDFTKKKKFSLIPLLLPPSEVFEQKSIFNSRAKVYFSQAEVYNSRAKLYFSRAKV